MRQPHIDDRVRLTTDIPELELHQGDVGIVCSRWFAPTEAYEVEFGLPGPTRALLMAGQFQLDDHRGSMQQHQ